MKQIIIHFFFTLLVNVVSAQTLDSLNYLRSFEQQKAQYIGQPFSVLLNAMVQVQPKTVRGGRNFKNKNQIPFCTFYFINPDNVSSNGVVYMIIDWQTPIPLQDINYYTNKNHYHFTSEELQFYGGKIIKDISIFVHR